MPSPEAIESPMTTTESGGGLAPGSGRASDPPPPHAVASNATRTTATIVLSSRMEMLIYLTPCPVQTYKSGAVCPLPLGTATNIFPRLLRRTHDDEVRAVALREPTRADHLIARRAVGHVAVI